MRVLHIAQALSRKFGGVQSALLDLATAQAAAGMKVDVVSTNVDVPRGVLDVPTDRSVLQHGVQVRYFPTQFRPLLFSRQVKVYVDRNVGAYDIVHIHSLYRFPPTYAAWQARKQCVPYIISPHGSLDPYLYGRSTRSVWLKRLYERWFDWPNLRGAGAIHYTTEDECRRASFLGFDTPSFIVPIGLDWSRYVVLPARGSFRSRYALGEAPIVLFLGRINFKKGLNLLIPAFASLRRLQPTARLIIAGPENDDYGQKVHGWVRDYGLQDAVLFVGHLEGGAVTQAYLDADVFVLPSYTENFGMTVAEALACGTPVVISDQVNIHAEVAAAGAGIVTRCDAAELTEALDTLLRDTSRRQTMGNAGRALVQQKWTWEVVVRQLIDEYERVIERNRASRALV